MDEQARTKRIALELEKLKHELARQDRELADMMADHGVTYDQVAARIAELDEKEGPAKPARAPKPAARPALPPNAFIVRG